MRSLLTIALALGVPACDPGGAVPADAGASGSAPDTAAAAEVVPDEAIDRLPLAAFPWLPDAMREALAARGCTVPQTWFPDEPHNVVSGELAAAGQVDLAILCSRDDASAVVVVWGGPVRCADTMEATPDRHWTQDIGAGIMGYSRALGVLGPAEAFAYLSNRGHDPPPLDHDVLSDAFLEKASTMYYCRSGEWLALGGAD